MRSASGAWVVTRRAPRETSHRLGKRTFKSLGAVVEEKPVPALVEVEVLWVVKVDLGILVSGLLTVQEPGLYFPLPTEPSSYFRVQITLMIGTKSAVCVHCTAGGWGGGASPPPPRRPPSSSTT